VEWRPFGHVAIDHKLLTAREQWENSRHQSLWLVVVKCNVDKRDAPEQVSTVIDSFWSTNMRLVNSNGIIGQSS